ncbi:MAG: undecaprenyl phosphate translocase family protein, partial [Cyclonatronaceae bacterium]
MSTSTEAAPAPASSATQNERDTTSWKEAPALFLKSFAIGAADVVPGVSGGTMALIFGMYARLLNAIKSVNTDAAKALLRVNIGDFFREFHWKFV